MAIAPAQKQPLHRSNEADKAVTVFAPFRVRYRQVPALIKMASAMRDSSGASFPSPVRGESDVPGLGSLLPANRLSVPMGDYRPAQSEPVSAPVTGRNRQAPVSSVALLQYW